MARSRGVDRVAINPAVFKNFDNRLKSDMVGETQAFFKEILVAIPLLFNLLMQILPCSMHLWPNTMDWLDLNPKNLSEFRFEVLVGQAACSVMPPLICQVQTELTLIQLNGRFGLGNGCFMTLPILLHQMSRG